MNGGSGRLLLALGAMAGVVLAVVTAVSFLGGSGSHSLGDDFLLVTRVIAVRTSTVELDGRDAGGDQGSSAQANLDVLGVPLAGVEAVDVYDGSPDLPDPLLLVRDSLRFGSVEPLLESERLVLLVQPLLTSTRDRGIERSVRIIALDDRGGMVGSDWDDADGRRLGEVIAWGRERGLGPAETVTRLIRAVLEPTGGPDEAELLRIIGD